MKRHILKKYGGGSTDVYGVMTLRQSDMNRGVLTNQHIKELIIIAKDEAVYEIIISANQNEWNTHEQDIQHVLGTFRWK